MGVVHKYHNNMFDLHKIREEYDTKKIAIAMLLLFVIVGGIFAGLMLVSGRIDIRNRAANSCPVGVLKMVTCKFTVDSTVPFTYVVTVSSSTDSTSNSDGTTGLYSATSGEREIVPTEPSTNIQESVEVQFTGTYTCNVKVTATVTNACGSKTATDTKNTSLVCTPPDDITPPDSPDGPGGPTGPTGPDGPGGGSGPACKDCSKVEVKLDYEEPKDAVNPTLTPPNVKRDDLKIGRLTIEFLGECGKTMSCADVKKIEFRAYNNDSCSGQPNVSPIPLNTEDEDTLFGRYGSSIKCDDALIKAGDPYNEGARFRLHQANGDQCRCYKVNVEFEGDPEDRLVCPNMPQENICCPTVCAPVEIVDNPDDPNDGCPGDPSGPRPNDPSTCYLTPLNACANRNARTRFKTHAINGGQIGFDDDFKAPADDMQPVGQGDEDHDYIYNDGGSYDVKLTCNEDLLCLNGVCPPKQTCTKRISVTCSNPPGGPPGNPPGGGGGGEGGNTPPPGPPACIVPPISGVCIDQPAT